MRRIVMAAAALCVTAPAYAQDATFDFEDQSVTSGLTSLSLTDNGVTLDISRPGSTFGIENLAVFSGPASYGARTLSPFGDSTSNTAFVLDFSTSLSGFSVDFGDFGADVDAITIIGYEGLGGTGNIVFTLMGSLASTGFTFEGGSASASNQSPFLSVSLIGGSATFPNSVYFDNIQVDVAAVGGIPEPATWGMMLIGFAATGMAFRRRQQGLSAAPASV